MSMTRGELEYAKRRALNKLDEWNDVACVVQKNSGYYYELQSVIEDSVECGAQAAIGIEVPLSSGFKGGCAIDWTEGGEA